MKQRETGREQSNGKDALHFWLPLALLIGVLAVLPFAALRLFDLDERTEANVAQEALTEKYGLELVGMDGRPIPEGESRATHSEFSLDAGATTKDVPFFRKGVKVLCTVHMVNDEADSVTATCRRDRAAQPEA